MVNGKPFPLFLGDPFTTLPGEFGGNVYVTLTYAFDKRSLAQ